MNAMPRRHRVRGIAKWSLAASAAVVALVAVASYRWQVGQYVSYKPFSISDGAVSVSWAAPEPESGRISVLGYLDEGGWYFRQHPPRNVIARLKPTWEMSDVGFNRRAWVNIPLWLPLALCAIPTAVLFYVDRKRPPPGHCRSCGYDLTGNVSGVCPECGSSVRNGTSE